MVGDEFAKQVSWEEGSKSRTVSVCYKHFPPNCPAKIFQVKQWYQQRHHQCLVVHRHLYLARSHQNSCGNQKKIVTSEVRTLKSVAGHTTDTFDGLMLYCNKVLE